MPIKEIYMDYYFMDLELALDHENGKYHNLFQNILIKHMISLLSL